ncbi:NAD(+) diphosphatase [Candidatus Vondammii sp. HM_W22]|uniref:NAD(+) diphosphatase n=1 Tax=Candidatus Vondammii sp. HM_W22 TaxID=2687299 RepID=UPI001F1359F7|nr:NAD(+) diphosphatase [Candidatus Vondammii sp. HM_W22]
MAENHLSYAGGHLNRASGLRKDPNWVADQLTRGDALIVPVWRNCNLVSDSKHTAPYPKAVLCTISSADRILEAASNTVFLGLDGERPLFAVDLSDHDEIQAASLAEEHRFTDLRHLGLLMEAQEATLLAYAREMLYWHRHNRFCGKCGSATTSQNGGHALRCSNSACNKETYPRTDPAVIMIVEHLPSNGEPPLCLLGRQKEWPKGIYSTLAGYVDPGESLEEAVAREVYEEAGIPVKNVVYLASQPWPFPSSIMLGFSAQAESTIITLDQDELEDARWFTVEEIRNFTPRGDGKGKFHLPRKDSIAYFLVKSWLARFQTRRNE